MLENSDFDAPGQAPANRVFGIDANGTRIERNRQGTVRVKYSANGIESLVHEVYYDPYHEGVLILKPQMDLDEGVFMYIDTGIVDIDLNSPDDLRKVFAGDLWLRRARPMRAYVDSINVDPNLIGTDNEPPEWRTGGW